MLTSPQKERYSRQIRFEGIGEAGQERISAAHVAVVGCGALGTLHASALARAGVGALTLIDRDYVEESNLQRQWLFDEAAALSALPKAEAARQALKGINSGILLEAHVSDLTPANIAELLEGAQLVLDGTDNFETRFLVNDYCVSHRIPWVYGAAVGSYGISMPVWPGHTACLRCVYPEPPKGAQPTCETSGVLASITALIASIQAADALRILCGAPETFRARLTSCDVWNGGMRQIDAPPRDAGCPCCVRREFPYLEGKHRPPVSLCGRNAVQIHERNRPLDLEALATALRPLGEVRANDFALRFFCPPYELTVFPDGRAIIKGTTDPGVARAVYARYIGN